MGLSTIEHIQKLQQYDLCSPKWASKAIKRAVDFDAQILGIEKVTGIGYDQVKEEVEKYARENPVSLEQAASIIADRFGGEFNAQS